MSLYDNKIDVILKHKKITFLMSIYVAGKWDDKDNIVQKQLQFQSLGYKITHDWTKNESLTRNSEELGNFAMLDINGVIEADYMSKILTK